MKRYIHLLILPVIFASMLAGCVMDNDHAAEVTRWQVLYSQEPSLDTVSEKGGWKNITLPFMSRIPYQPKRAIQYLWLKGKVMVEKPDDYYGISLGRVYLVDRVYINGTLVGKHLPSDVQDLHYPRNYEIPGNILVHGANTVHVYLGIYGAEYGGLADSVRLLSKDLFLRTAILMEFLYRQLTVGILVLFLGGIILILMELIWRPLEASSFIVLMILIIWISYLIALFSPFYPFNMDFRITLLWGCACLIPIFFFLYIQYYYKVFLTILNMIYIPILVICGILSMINQDTASPYYMGRVLGIFAVAVSIPVHGYLFYYITRRRSDRTIIYFLILGVVPAGVIVWDIINTMYMSHYPPLYHIYTLPAIVILFITLRIKETMTRQIHLEVLYGRLKFQLGDMLLPPDTAEPGEPDDSTDGAVFTPAMEEKFRKVIDFLKGNYLSDISREGLAMAMDLSPDHMSRKFKAYTGYRIGDYINNLRIEDAARQLLETDHRIIDIAFSVGFESLVTFNRAFLKVMDMTPSEYRKKRVNNDHDVI